MARLDVQCPLQAILCEIVSSNIKHMIPVIMFWLDTLYGCAVGDRDINLFAGIFAKPKEKTLDPHPASAPRSLASPARTPPASKAVVQESACWC